MKLLDSTSLAKELGLKSTWLIVGAKRAAKHYGDTPFAGRYTTIQKFMAWLQRHPDFVANHWIRVPAVSPKS